MVSITRRGKQVASLQLTCAATYVVCCRIGPTQTNMQWLVRRFGLATHEQWVTGRKVMKNGGKHSSYGGLIPNMSVLGLLEAQFSLLTRLNRMAVTV